MITKVNRSQVHIRTIQVGDTIEHGGHVVTVGQKDLRNDMFMGVSIFGDTYSLGSKPVTKIEFPTQKEIDR